MAARSYTLPTIKTLFAEANMCAFPACGEALIFEDRGSKTVIAEIAHIRSEKSNGPRHDPLFTGEVDGAENLLLLCGKHHKPVDRHESTYPVAELLRWKAAQIAAAASRGGTSISDKDARRFAHTSQQALTACTQIARLTTRVDQRCNAARDKQNAIETDRLRKLNWMRRQYAPIVELDEDGEPTGPVHEVEMSPLDLHEWRNTQEEALQISMKPIQDAINELGEEVGVLRMMDDTLGTAANRVLISAQASMQFLTNEDALNQSLDGMRAALRDMWLEANPEP